MPKRKSTAEPQILTGICLHDVIIEKVGETTVDGVVSPAAVSFLLNGESEDGKVWQLPVIMPISVAKEIFLQLSSNL